MQIKYRQEFTRLLYLFLSFYFLLHIFFLLVAREKSQSWKGSLSSKKMIWNVYISFSSLLIGQRQPQKSNSNRVAMCLGIRRVLKKQFVMSYNQFDHTVPLIFVLKFLTTVTLHIFSLSYIEKKISNELIEQNISVRVDRRLNENKINYSLQAVVFQDFISRMA